ncbi:MAG: methyltransferase domain-containing protein [Candidatus Latescibacterota bacterium]|jgi:SAM-dependent methyltransferase
MSRSIDFQELRMPADLQPDQMPDLLRYWYLGSRARRHMMLRRFVEVDSRAVARVDVTAAGSHSLLDIGSAWGFNVMATGRLGIKTTGIDLVADQFDVGQRIAAENDAPFPVAAADAARLPFGNERFDVITMVETLEHIYLDDRRAALDECYRVLKPGGVVVLSTPNYDGAVERFKRFTGRHPALRKRLPTMCYPEEGTKRDGYHPYSYHHPLPDDRIAGLLNEAGFRVESVSHFLFMLKNTPNWAYPLAAILERIGESLPVVKRLAATSCFVAQK